MRQKAAFAALGCVLLAAACAPRKTVKSAQENQPSAAAPAAPETQASGAPAAPATEVSEASVRGADFSAAADLESARFDYDSYALSAAALDVLKKNAQYLKGHSGLEVLATGNCDERGTIAYNLALGQKRAKAVRDYYIRLGVSGKSIATISFGKEKPLCPESNEGCWAKNRRAETLVRTRSAMSPGAR